MSNRELPPLETVRMEDAEFNRRNRRSFAKWAILFAAGGFGLRAIFNAEEDRGLPWPLRRMNEIGESVWQSQFGSARAPERDEPVLTKPRLNGDVGIDTSVDGRKWRLQISSPSLDEDFSVSLEDLQKLPQVTETFEFKCVEGWSQWMTFTGVRFTDFTTAYRLTELPQYAKLTSVDGGYYVAMDMKSMMHPQTLLCLSMNGSVLSHSHGFPVRLVTSVKYGVKSIKQIGSIAFAETMPADYWAENGYGEYLGL